MPPSFYRHNKPTSHTTPADPETIAYPCLLYKDDNGIYKSFEEEILKSGLAVIYKYSNLANELNKYENLNKMREIAKMSNNYNLVILDTFNGEYYEPDCQYIQGHGSTELINLKSGVYGYKKANCPQ